MTSRDDRPKAQDLFSKANLVFGEKVGFSEAFPGVASARVIVRESGQGVWGESVRHFSEQSLGEYINCSNSLCYAGGFSIASVLREMVSRRETTRKGSALCKGNEASPKGKRVYRKCVNFFQYDVALTYHEDAPKERSYA